MRVLFTFFLILLFLAISSSLIGLCSIYVSANAVDCFDQNIPGTLIQAIAASQNDLQRKCFCQSKLSEAYRPDIQNYCGSLLNQLYIENGLQYAVIGVSGLTNFLFGIVVDKIINFSRPYSYSSGYMLKVGIYTVFMILNTAILPTLLFADIFGFKPAHYISFITIFSTKLYSYFGVANLSLNVDFTYTWYKDVSSIFTNYVIFDIAFTLVFFILYKIMSNCKVRLKNEEGMILQKKMNERITSWKLNAYVEYSYFNLIIFICTFYCVGIPILLPLGFANLWIKYITNRSLIQNNSSRI